MPKPKKMKEINPKGWEEKIRKDYRGIISEAQIEATIDYWRDFIRQMHNQAREEERKRLRERIWKEQEGWKQELQVCREWVKKTKESMDRSKKMFSDTPDEGELRAAAEQFNLAHGNLQVLNEVLDILEEKVCGGECKVSED